MAHIPFHIITFGCQMNVNDSRWLVNCLKSRDFNEASVGEAAVVVLNTCAVREKPEQKVKQAIARIVSENPSALICVLGCVAQSLGDSLFECGPQVRLVAGGDGLPFVPDAILDLLDQPTKRQVFLEFQKNYFERGGGSVVNGSAYVNIMQGCDNFCSYCIVPYSRGRQKSRSLAEIINECEVCLSYGAKEITLLGQNVNAWNKDKAGTETFSTLLEAIASLPELERLRYVAVYPTDMDERTIAMFGQFSNICPRIHLPLQAGSDRILAAMRRRYDKNAFLRLVGKLRAARPDIAISTDLIVGFPGETEGEFAETLEMMEECGFMSSYSFCYSDRPPARAVLMPDKITDCVKLERLARLQAVQDKLSRKWLDGRLGDITTVLLENQSRRNNPSGTCWQGRDPYGAVVNVEAGRGDLAGVIIEARITAAKKHSLVGVPLAE